jgi:hypothetical protein
MKSKILVCALLCVCVGVIIGNTIQATWAEAAGRAKSSPWILQSGAYASGIDSRFYAVKMNLETGETWVLSVQGNADKEEWIQLPKKDMSGKSNR